MGWVGLSWEGVTERVRVEREGGREGEGMEIEMERRWGCWVEGGRERGGVLDGEAWRWG